MNTNRSLRSLISSSSNTTEQQKLLASDGATSDSFGYSISMYNNLIAVGAIRGEYTAIYYE